MKHEASLAALKDLLESVIQEHALKGLDGMSEGEKAEPYGGEETPEEEALESPKEESLETAPVVSKKPKGVSLSMSKLSLLDGHKAAKSKRIK